MLKTNAIPKITPLTPYFESVDVDLLIELMTYQTTSWEATEDCQDEFINFLIAWTEEHIKGATYYKNSLGDLYITKGKANLYPCVVSHVDIVHDFVPDLIVAQIGNLIIGIDESTGKQAGIGADPKNGVYFALEMLRTLDVVKVVLFKNEEAGCCNSSQPDKKFFKNCSMIAQLDRRSFTNDFIDYTNGVEVCSDEFTLAVTPCLLKYGYKTNNGSCTDVGAIVKAGVGISAFNFSNGSINEHCDYEVCSIPHLLNAINAAYDIILTVGYKKKWKHTPEEDYWNGWNERGWQKFYDKPKSKSWNNDVILPLKDKDRYMDVFEDYDFIDTARHYHHTPGWSFKESDEDYLQDLIKTGTCPICSSSPLQELKEKETHCYNCAATYNIPYGKSMKEVENELYCVKDEPDYVNCG